jgi:hypothetical protein
MVHAPNIGAESAIGGLLRRFSNGRERSAISDHPVHIRTGHLIADRSLNV